MLFDGIREVPRRYPDIPLAILHLGTTTLPGGMVVTLDEKHGCELVQIVEPRYAVPVHLDDYDVFRFSQAEFDREVAAHGLDDRIRRINRGQTMTFGADREPEVLA